MRIQSRAHTYFILIRLFVLFISFRYLVSNNETKFRVPFLCKNASFQLLVEVWTRVFELAPKLSDVVVLPAWDIDKKKEKNHRL